MASCLSILGPVVGSASGLMSELGPCEWSAPAAAWTDGLAGADPCSPGAGSGLETLGPRLPDGGTDGIAAGSAAGDALGPFGNAVGLGAGFVPGGCPWTPTAPSNLWEAGPAYPENGTAGIVATAWAGDALGPFGNAAGLSVPGEEPGYEWLTPGNASLLLSDLGPVSIGSGLSTGTGNREWPIVAEMPPWSASAVNLNGRSVAIAAALPAWVVSGVARSNSYAIAALLPAWTAWLDKVRHGSFVIEAGVPHWTAAQGWVRGGSYLIATAIARWTAMQDWRRGGSYPVAVSLQRWEAAATFVTAPTWPIAARLPTWAAAVGEGMRFSATFPALTASLDWKPGKVWRIEARLPAWRAAAERQQERRWAIAAALPAWASQSTVPRTLPPLAISGALPAWTATGRHIRGRVWQIDAVLPSWTARAGRSWRGSFSIAASFPRWSAASGLGVGESEPAAVYAMNTETFAVTQYLNFPFLWLGAADGVPIGATPGGVYLLQGEDDASQPINCSLLSGQDDFGDNRLKRIPHVHADIDGEAKILAEADGVRGEYPFSGRARLPLGLSANRWAFGVRNVDGARIVVRSIQPAVEILAKRAAYPSQKWGGRYSIAATLPRLAASVEKP